MTFGYVCDAECDAADESAFTTVTIDLDELPDQQAAATALLFDAAGLVDLDEYQYHDYKAIRSDSQPEGMCVTFPTVELHWCPDHTIDALRELSMLPRTQPADAAGTDDEQP
jgi:hypothetical protein